MAGRGCTIQIEVHGGENGTNVISLAVALHSPLEVLREQLEMATNIPLRSQILILCDLSDPERNSDIILQDRDHLSLYDCGVREGSFLTLHALGATIQRNITMDTENKRSNDSIEVDMLSLSTRITPNRADHSYNGIIFDVVNKGPFEIDLFSVWIAGMLGRLRVLVRDRPWEKDSIDNRNNPHWWAQRESVSPDGWQVVADQECMPSWDRPIEIKFNTPFRLQPHSVHGIYCHSNLPDDLGIQYQSYNAGDVVAESEFLQILPGVGHTGSEPFDDRNGWYRKWRGLAGSISYTAKRKGWSITEHVTFPAHFRRGVLCLLMCNQRIQDCGQTGTTTNTGRKFTASISNVKTSKAVPPSGGSYFHRLPRDLVIYILEFADWDWFDNHSIESVVTQQANHRISSSAPEAPRRSRNTRDFINHLLILSQRNLIPTEYMAGIHHLATTMGLVNRRQINDDDDDDEDDDLLQSSNAMDMVHAHDYQYDLEEMDEEDDDEDDEDGVVEEDELGGEDDSEDCESMYSDVETNDS